MKKTLILMTVIAFVLTLIPTAFAAFPHAIWEPLGKFEAAVAAGNDHGILEYGEKIIAIAEGMADGEEKTSFLAGKYDVLANCTERMGMNDKAIEYYQKYLPYGEKKGWLEGVILAKNKIIQLSTILKFYGEVQDETIAYAGGKFEPQRGVYFGATYDNDPRIVHFRDELIRPYFPKDESVYLMYLEWGDDITQIERYTSNMNDAKQNNKMVLLAWNIYTSMHDIENHTDHVSRTIDFLASYDIPVFIRFGAEMNAGTNGDDPEAYINAFRTVSSYTRNKPSIAMVWSPSDIGAWNRPYDLYYPGNEYVDWVGLSSYNIPYYQGDSARADEEPLDSYLFLGKWANPLTRIKKVMDFMQEYGINKPVMLSECGTPHSARYTGASIQDFGEPLFYRLYAELPRYYPQIKLMCYFNVSLPGDAGDYSIYKNSRWQELYNQFVSSDYFVSTPHTAAPFAFKEITGAVKTDKLSAVFYYPKTTNLKVEYYYDGEWAHLAESPYEYSIPQNSGTHIVTAASIVDGQLYRVQSFAVRDGYVEPMYRGENIRVFYNGQQVNFPDTQPQIIDDRTLIPIRGVFEAMGATVTWDDNTQTATLTKGDKVISVTIGSNQMKVNSDIIELDVPPQTIGYRTMVPLRAISQALGAKVSWESDTQSVVILDLSRN